MEASRTPEGSMRLIWSSLQEAEHLGGGGALAAQVRFPGVSGGPDLVENYFPGVSGGPHLGPKPPETPGSGGEGFRVTWDPPHIYIYIYIYIYI